MTDFGKEVQYRIVEDFQSFRRVKIELEKVEISKNKLSGELRLLNKTDRIVDFDTRSGREVSVVAHFLKGNSQLGAVSLVPVTGQMSPGEVIELVIDLELPKEHQEIDLSFSLKVQDLPAPINSFKYHLEYD